MTNNKNLSHIGKNLLSIDNIHLIENKIYAFVTNINVCYRYISSGEYCAYIKDYKQLQDYNYFIRNYETDFYPMSTRNKIRRVINATYPNTYDHEHNDKIILCFDSISDMIKCSLKTDFSLTEISYQQLKEYVDV